MELTEPCQLWVHLRGARQIKQRDEGLVGNSLIYELQWILRVSNVRQALQD